MFEKTQVVVEEYGRKVIKRAQKNLNTDGFGGQKSNRKKNASGKLSKSLYFKIRKTDKGFVQEFLSSEGYAAIVEEGRKAGKMPPVHSIEKWLEAKRLRLRKVKINSSGQKVNVFVQNNAKNRRSAAFAIASSMKKRAVKGIYFYTDAMNYEFEQLPEPLQQAYVEDLADIIFTDFKKVGINITKA